MLMLFTSLYKSYAKVMLSFFLSVVRLFFLLITPLCAMEGTEEDPLKKPRSLSSLASQAPKESSEFRLSPTLFHVRRESSFQQTEEKEPSFPQSLVNSIFRTSPGLAVLVSLEGKILKVNERWRDILGWEPEKVHSLSYTSLLHLKDQERLKSIKKESLISPEQLYLKNAWKLRRKDGSYREIEWVHIPMEYSLGEALEKGKALLLIGKDVTDRKEEKKQQKRKIKSLYKSLEQKNKLLQALSDIQSIYI